MKRLLLTIATAATFGAAALPQQKAPEGFAVIEDQPEGELRIYSRSGMTVNEDRETAEITTGTQGGTVNIVFGADGAVYIQCPVSDSYYDGWVKCELSPDGRTMTMPTGQYTAYTRSFDMAVQVWMMRYDEEQHTYVADENVSEVVYTIAEDGAIAQQGTDGEHFLGVVNRCFGDTFAYLDFEWHGFGDYETVYTPYCDTNQQPPAGLATETLTATTGCFDGMGWDALSATVQMGFDGDDVWLQGVTPLLPKAWVRGRRSGNTLTFPSGQTLGSYYSSMVYLVGAVPDENDEPAISDIVFTSDGQGTWTSYTDIFVNSSKEDINFVAYYMGLTLSDKADRSVTAPPGLHTDACTMTYREPDDDGVLRDKSAEVEIGSDGGCIYIRGVTPVMPDAWVKGCVVSDGLVEFPSPQFLGSYLDDSGAAYPIFFQAYDGQTGQLHPSVTFACDTGSLTLTAPSSAIGIGINKTGLLLLQSFYDTTFTPATPVGVYLAKDRDTATGSYFNLTGQRVGTPRRGGLYIADGRKTIVK